MVICGSCRQGFHTACFGMLAVPHADPWYCRGCTMLQQLAVGQQIITESPQNLHPGGTSAQPHHTQGLYLATIASMRQVQQDATGRCACTLAWHHCLTRCASTATHNPTETVHAGPDRIPLTSTAVPAMHLHQLQSLVQCDTATMTQNQRINGQKGIHGKTTSAACHFDMFLCSPRADREGRRVNRLEWLRPGF